MPSRVPYTIQADVIDISQDVPQKGDFFFIDTNIWYWLAYNPPAAPSPSYANYFSSALVNDSTLCYSEILLPELAHIIETNERHIFNRRHGSNFSVKGFRRNHPSQRVSIASKVKLVWDQVKRDAHSLKLELYDSAIGDRAISRLESQMVDGYDLFILEIMENENITKVITHDSDYLTVPNIQVFTADTDVIDDARTQGKLLIR